MLVKVDIAYYESGSQRSYTFVKDVTSLDDLKVAFLKRYGNVVKFASSKAKKEYRLVKELTYNAQSSTSWVDAVNNTQYWTIRIRRI